MGYSFCSAIFIAIFVFTIADLTPISGHQTSNNTDGPWQGFRQLAGCHKGEKAAGLARVKQYFQRFGYIAGNNNNSIFSDSFDDDLESAIKTYQHNFNLNATGILDPKTVQQIIRPRCGVGDIINGTSSMNSGKPNPTVAGFHTVAHYSFFYGTPRWPSSKRDLTYAFSTSNLVVSIDDMRTIFTRAFARWSAVTPLTFTETDFYQLADLRIAFFSGDHGDGEPFDGSMGTLAHAFSPPNGRFHLDSDENWVVDTRNSLSATEIDLESVAVHEIGHLLGLGHSSVEEAIMYPTISSGTKRVELASDDIQGIQELYGANPNSNISSPTTQESDTNGGGPSTRIGSWVYQWWHCSLVIYILACLFL